MLSRCCFGETGYNNLMNKVFIYGVPGSGKTYASIVLQKKLGIELLEADILRAEFQKDTTPKKDPFFFVGTCQAYKYFGEINSENCKKGLLEVRKAMSEIVSREIEKSDRLIVEGAFLDPNILNSLGKMVLVVTSDEAEHRKHFFENRLEEEDKINEFKAVRLVQESLITEARNLNIDIIENNDKILDQLDECLIGVIK